MLIIISKIKINDNFNIIFIKTKNLYFKIYLSTNFKYYSFFLILIPYFIFTCTTFITMKSPSTNKF